VIVLGRVRQAASTPGGFSGSPLRFRLEKWAWVALTAAVVVAYIWFRAFWNDISILYLAVVSNYALVAAFASCEQAAEAKQRATDNGGAT
jgi:hypothetical protein